MEVKPSKNELDEAKILNKESLILNAVNVTHLPNFNDEHIAQMVNGGWTYTGNVLAKRFDTLIWILKTLVGWHKLFEKKKDKLILTLTAEDIIRAKKENKLAVSLLLDWWHPSMAIESAGLDDDLELCWMLYKLGVRQIHPVYYSRSIAGDGFAEEAFGRDGGLSIYGRKLLSSMNKNNILVDLAHASNNTILDACEMVKAPAIFSHGGCRSIRYHTRNISDEGMKAIAETGGCTCIIDWMHMIKKQPPEPTIEDYLNHVEHVIKIVGINHVAIGVDHYNTGEYGLVRGQLTDNRLSHAQEQAGKSPFPSLYMPEPGVKLHGGIFADYDFVPLTAGLLSRGFSKQEIRKFLGENLLRTFRKVWK